MMNQKQKRKRYKEYIRSLRETDQYRNGEDIPYEVVRSYWSKGGARPTSVWEIIVPIRMRTEEEKEMLHKMRILLDELRYATIEKSSKACNNDAPIENENGSGHETDKNKNASCGTHDTYDHTTDHTLSVHAEETLYIIYLATLSAERRFDFVTNFESPGTLDVVRKQVINEADMIASAIEMSDELTL